MCGVSSMMISTWSFCVEFDDSSCLKNGRWIAPGNPDTLF
jgi:hypothetical protein